ncbi:MAG TPA: hypothetical protein VHM19_15560, partial [Polyangiales bacterium]|nr:hypothetical protein [Polyangiales bacterium]
MSARRWYVLALLAGCRFGGGDGVSGDPLAINEPAASDRARSDSGSSGGAAPTPSASTGGTTAT